jgi:hypothetical protein
VVGTYWGPLLLMVTHPRRFYLFGQGAKGTPERETLN